MTACLVCDVRWTNRADGGPAAQAAAQAVGAWLEGRAGEEEEGAVAAEYEERREMLRAAAERDAQAAAAGTGAEGEKGGEEVEAPKMPTSTAGEGMKEEEVEVVFTVEGSSTHKEEGDES